MYELSMIIFVILIALWVIAAAGLVSCLLFNHEIMTYRKLSLFQKFLEDIKGIKTKKPYLFRFDNEVFEEYTSLMIGKTKIGLQ